MKKNRSEKKIPQLPSEQSPAQKAAHRELVHEDMDPIYPFDPVEKPKKEKRSTNLSGK